MKKKVLHVLLILVLLMAVLVTLTACGDDSNDKEDNDDEEIEEVVESDEDDEEDTKKSDLDEVEIEAFNGLFTEYEGKANGTNVKSLLLQLVANATTNKENEDYLPSIDYIDQSGEESEIDGGDDAVRDIDTYTDGITKIRISIANTHNYTVSFDYSDSGLIDEVIIKY